MYFSKGAYCIIHYQIRACCPCHLCTLRCAFLCAGPLDLSKVPDCGIGVLTVKVQPQYAGLHGACKLTSNVRAISGRQCVGVHYWSVCLLACAVSLTPLMQ